MRLYVAGPMSGLPEYNYPAFHEAARKLRAAGYEVLNPADTGRPLGDPWQAFMRDAISLLIECDAVALLDGWQNSRGARVESNLARNLSMTRWPVDRWLTEAGVNPYERCMS